MKINLNIDENERRRILEMHNSAKPVISEQSTVFVFSEESKPATKFIMDKFQLYKSNPNWSGMSSDEQLQYLKNVRQQLSTMDINSLVDDAKAANVTSANTMSLQNDLVRVSGKPELKFISDGLPKNFVDGKLGTNTAAAWIDYQIYLSSKGESKIPVTKQEYVQPGSAQPAIKGTYSVGK